MTQLPLTLPPAAAKADPASSHAAARELTSSGARQRQVELVAELVRQWPGCTSLELAELSGHDRHMLAKRLPDAAACGLVRKVTRDGVVVLRTCRAGGRLACCWEVG